MYQLVSFRTSVKTLGHPELFQRRTNRTTISTMLARRMARAAEAAVLRLKIWPKLYWLETLKNVSAEIEA
jgi:hypothetical protein